MPPSSAHPPDPRAGNATRAAVRSAQQGERDDAISTLVLAFADDPTTRWLYPEPGHYLERMPDLVEAYGGRAFTEGTALVTEGCTGAALWLAPGVEPDPAAIEGAVLGSTRAAIHCDLVSVGEQLASYHPREPHWYLPMIGVDPVWQGRGVGGALLRRVLEICNREDLPAYLESSSPRSVSLYRRCGFEVVGAVQAGSSPTWIPMLWRGRSG